MNCEEATKLMDGYLDGELDPITSQTIEQHLGGAVTVIKPTKHMDRSFVRLATQRLTTRRPQNYVNEFNPRCAKKSPEGRCETLSETLSRCSPKGSQGHGTFSRGHHGIG